MTYLVEGAWHSKVLLKLVGTPHPACSEVSTTCSCCFSHNRQALKRAWMMPGCHGDDESSHPHRCWGGRMHGACAGSRNQTQSKCHAHMDVMKHLIGRKRALCAPACPMVAFAGCSHPRLPAPLCHSSVSLLHVQMLVIPQMLGKRMPCILQAAARAQEGQALAQKASAVAAHSPREWYRVPSNQHSAISRPVTIPHVSMLAGLSTIVHRNWQCADDGMARAEQHEDDGMARVEQTTIAK